MNTALPGLRRLDVQVAELVRPRLTMRVAESESCGV